MTADPTLLSRLLSVSDEAHSVLFDQSVTGQAVLDTSGRVLRSNASLRAIVDERLLRDGCQVADLFTLDSRRWLAPLLEVALSGHAVAPSSKLLRVLARPQTGTEKPERQHDGFSATGLAGLSGERTVDVSAVPLIESDGSVSGVLLRLYDVTHQARLEAQLAHNETMQAVGTLAGGVAHDFNNLLGAMLAATDEALARPDTSADTLDDLGQIRLCAERGAALVRQLLAFGGQQVLQPRPVVIDDALERTASFLGRMLGGRIRLDRHLEGSGRVVLVDPVQLDRVLVNLAVNARDAMPSGGTLTLRSSHLVLDPELDPISGHGLPAGVYVTIEVVDTGNGIPPAVLPHVFEPFFTTRRERGGTGLGLASVHGIVRQSGGWMDVDSTLGQGTCFRIHLPQHDAGVAAAVPAALPIAPPSSAPRVGLVLLVDDEPVLRRLTERALARRGWTVIAACSGEQALALTEATLGDLRAVISDVMMPGLDGPSLVRTLRGKRPDLPAILVSGYAEESLRDELGLPGFHFLSKPYPTQSLLDLLSSITDDPGR